MSGPTHDRLMDDAVRRCIDHVDGGGLPFVGVVVDGSEAVSTFGVNRVRETGDPTAHAEIVAMRDALATGSARSLDGTSLLATGEPCGLCYRFAIDHGVARVFVAVDRDTVADAGFDYRSSYAAFGVTDALRASLLHMLPVARGMEPFTHYQQLDSRARHSPTRSTQSTKGPS